MNALTPYLIPALFLAAVLLRLALLWWPRDRRGRVETWARTALWLWGLRLAVWHLEFPPTTGRGYETVFFIALTFLLESIISWSQRRRYRGRPSE